MERIKPTESVESQIQAQAEFYERIGMWSPFDAGKYDFRLSPDVLELTLVQKKELDEMAMLIYGEGGYLDGSVRLIKLTEDPKFTGTRVGGAIRKSLFFGIRKDEQALQLVDDVLPFISRLDLVLTDGSDADNTSFKIVEVEGDKTHAFGYVTMPVHFNNIVSGNSQPLGVVEALGKKLQERGGVDLETTLIVGESEAFYERELSVFAKIANESGLNLSVVREKKLDVGRLNGVVVSIPTLTPAGLKGSGIESADLYSRYVSGAIDCLIPPKRFLGNKSLLGIIKNSLGDEELERVLRETFSSTALAGLRKYIPDTVAVNKGNSRIVADLYESGPEEWVVKEIMSSGMRGVKLPDKATPDEVIEARASLIRQQPYNFILQRKVPQKRCEFKFAERDNLGTVKSAPMFMRISPFVTGDGVAAVGVTARETPAVHGARDAIQIPVKFIQDD